MYREKIFKDRTNLRAILTAVITTFIGVTLLVLSEYWGFLVANPSAQTVIRDLGSLIIASVAVAAVWELTTRRAFVGELLAISGLAQELEHTGLIGISERWQGQVDWHRMFQLSEELDIFFTYGRTWRNTYRTELLEFSKRPDMHMNIVLPDPDDIALMTAIGNHMNMAIDDLSSRIKDSANDFINIFNEYMYSV